MHVEQQNVAFWLQLDQPDPQQRRLRQDQTDGRNCARSRSASSVSFRLLDTPPQNPPAGISAVPASPSTSSKPVRSDLMTRNQSAERRFEPCPGRAALPAASLPACCSSAPLRPSGAEYTAVSARKTAGNTRSLPPRNGDMLRLLHPGDRFGHLLNRRVAEHVPQRQIHVQLLVDLADQRRRPQGVAADVEEVVVERQSAS